MKPSNTVKEAWADVINDCKNAKVSIHFEQFLLDDFDEGKIGAEIVELFINKAKEGVVVKLHLDLIASINLISSPYYKKLEEVGVIIKFTPVRMKYFFPAHILKTRRNHRKLIIIDATIVYVGGVVFYELARDWYDFQVRLTDTVANAFVNIYDLSINSSDSDGKFNPKISDNLVVSVNDFRHRYINRILREKIRKSNNQITIITPYLSIPPRFFKDIVEARRRGVHVKVLVPFVTDNPFSVFSNQYMAYKLSKHDITVLASIGPINHAKLVFVDDWVTFGSCNFDYLSLMYNKELNLSTDDVVLYKQIDDCIQLYFENTIDLYNDHIKHQSFIKKHSILILGFLFQWMA